MAHLGRGGMGEVYEALDLTTDQRVALKRMSVDDTESKFARAELRFRREFHTLASLAHPRIVPVYDYGVDPSGPYYTMQMMPGEDLREVIRARRISPKETCLLLRDVASALALLHARGMVHRDLTPRNVRVVGERAILFDFGVLVDAGVAGDVAGTPAYIAPEMLYGQPIDGRADLYSLGVLAYSMLTGETPYPARTLRDLDALWRKTPVLPSEIADVPEALESLVVDLLCLEPMGRPQSAAILIDRLTALGDLEPDPVLAVQSGYAPTAALVGRDAELKMMRDELSEVVTNQASRQLYLEAESGTGKSRLLADLRIQAKLEGARCLAINCEDAAAEHGGRPFAAIAELLNEAFIVMPQEAYSACEPHAGLLCRVFPAIAKRFPLVDAEAESGEPAEDRMRLQRAVLEVVQLMAESGPLVILVDDIQRCDEASAASVASLAQRKIPRLLLGVARRLGEQVRAKSAVASLSSIQPRILLEGLNEDGVEALLRSVFGDAAHLPRLARWMHKATLGSPMFCAELSRQLVDEGVIRYASGSWVFPQDIPSDIRPEGLAQAMEKRIAKLSPAERSVGEMLAVHGSELELERTVDLIVSASLNADSGNAKEDRAASASQVESDTFAALAELRRQGVIVDLGDRFRFRHDSLREALLRGLSSEREQTLHRQVAETLLAEQLPEDPARQATIGWHLYRGDRKQEGARMLEGAGRALYEAQALSDCIAPLEVALAEAEASGAPRWRRAEMAFFLLSAGWVSHRPTGRRHSKRALELLGQECGLSIARKLRFIGWLPGFVLGFGWANLRWLARLGRGPNPLRALTSFVVGLSYSCALAYAANLKSELEELLEVARPFKSFRGQIPYAAYLAAHSMHDIVEGRLGGAADRLTESVELVTRRFMNPLTPDEKRLAEAGCRSMRVLVDVNQFESERLFADLERMEELDLRFYDLAAQTARVVRHRYRGEESIAREIEEGIEVETIQLGSWSTQLQVVLFAHPAYGLNHDVEGLKQCLDTLERYAAEGMKFEARIAITRGEIHRERGEFDDAFEVLGAGYKSLDESDALMRQYTASALAQTAADAYRHEVAIEWAKEGLAVGEDLKQRIWLPRLRCERAMALSENALGDQRAATLRLREAIDKAEAMECSSMAGQLHEAMARVSLHGGDRVNYEHHRLMAEDWLRPTENPGLIAILERLTEAGRQRRPRSIRPKRSDVSSRSTGSTYEEETRVVTATSHSRNPDDTVDSGERLMPMDMPTSASRPSSIKGPMDDATVASKPPLEDE
ncbi:MAG: protein kinase [Polyangiales bacterium]